MSSGLVCALNVRFTVPRWQECHVLGGGGRCTQFVHGRSRMTIDPRILTMPGRSTSGFHQSGKGGGGGVKRACRCWGNGRAEFLVQIIVRSLHALNLAGTERLRCFGTFLCRRPFRDASSGGWCCLKSRRLATREHRTRCGEQKTRSHATIGWSASYSCVYIARP